MPLTNQSPIEEAMNRIIGTPASSCNDRRNRNQCPGFGFLQPRSQVPYLYAPSWMTHPGMSATVDAAQPETAPAAAAAAPVAVSGPAATTYAQRLRDDYALSGFKGPEAENMISRMLAAGGYNANTIYDPNSAMNLNPDIQAGTLKTTSSGPYDPLKVTYKTG